MCCVLAVFAYIGILTGEVAGLEWVTVDEDIEELATFANIGASPPWLVNIHHSYIHCDCEWTKNV